MVTTTKLSTWKLQENIGSISITDNGCSVTSADNAIALLATMNAAVAIGVTLIIPEGVFVTSPITVPANCKIDGVGTLKLVSTANDYLLALSSGVMLMHVTLDGNNSAVSAGNKGCIKITGASNVFIDSVTINNPLGDGVYVTGASTNIEVDSVTVNNSARNGITVDSATGVDIINFQCTSPVNVAFPGIGISITSAGAAIKNINIAEALIRNAKSNGIDIVGSGSRNITNVTINPGVRVVDNTGNGIRVTNAEEIIINSIIVGTNTIDGIRIEGDAQNCRVTTCVANGNAGRGISEVVTTSTPNNNGFIYNVQVNNAGGNSTSIVGTSSFKVGS